jgi:hypothetical protein
LSLIRSLAAAAVLALLLVAPLRASAAIIWTSQNSFVGHGTYQHPTAAGVAQGLQPSFGPLASDFAVTGINQTFNQTLPVFTSGISTLTNSATAIANYAIQSQPQQTGNFFIGYRYDDSQFRANVTLTQPTQYTLGLNAGGLKLTGPNNTVLNLSAPGTGVLDPGDWQIESVTQRAPTGPNTGGPSFNFNLTLTEVPEPATAGLLSLAGAIGLVRRARR